LRSEGRTISLSSGVLAVSAKRYNFERGRKLFELSNYCLAECVTQTVTYITGSTTAAQGSYFAADVVSATDYYPFGMAIPGRSFSSDTYPHR
jgi:hypothetical protein